MEFQTTAYWDETLWNKAELVYNQAFPEHGRKNRKIIQQMFERRMCYLHTVIDQSEVIAMAITGIIKEAQVLIVDYLAVRKDQRIKGYGRQFMEYIKTWAQTTLNCKTIIIEVEAEDSEENHQRIRFWQQSGFQLTNYVHQYVWVPEPYQAMYFSFDLDSPLTDDGETLFKYITQFHKQAYSARF